MDRRQQTIEILEKKLREVLALPDSEHWINHTYYQYTWLKGRIQKLKEGSIDPSTVLIERLEME